MFSNKSLQTKLVLLNVSLVALLTAGSALLIWNVVRHEKALIKANLANSQDDLSDAIQDQFFERYGDVKAFAASMAADAALSNQARAALLTKDVSLYGIYDLILLVDTKGKLLAANTADPAGNALDISPLQKMDLSKTPWFEAAKQGQFNEDSAKGFTGVSLEQPHFDPLVEAVYKKPSWGTSFTTPVQSETGSVIGYLTTRAGFRWVEDVVKRTYLNLKKDGFVTSGFLMYGADGRVYINYVPEQNGDSLDFSRDKTTLQNMNLGQYPELEKLGIAHGKAGDGVYNEADTGQPRLLYFSPIKGSKFIDGYWNLALSFEEAEAYAELNNLIKKFIAMSFLTSLVALGLGLLFGNRLSKSLARLVESLHRQGIEVKEASEQVSETSDKLSSAASQQAAALQETVAAVNEISAMVGRTADMATQSRNTSQNSRNVAGDGKRTVDEMIQSMEDIRDSNKQILSQVEEGNKEISQIVRVISEIGNKTKVINDIVFQTKLLSFNASVEAARAGEHGKGFAVVAEEVGNLAQMSGSAAKEISDLLEQSVVKVQTIVEQTGQRVENLVVNAREKVAVGEDTARRCAQILEQILLNADEVNSLISEIASSAQEQARGVQEINSAMTQLDSVTQQNSASASQSSQLSGSLLAQSQGLSDLVEELNALVSGNGAAGAQFSRNLAGSPYAGVEARAMSVASLARQRQERNLTKRNRIFDQGEMGSAGAELKRGGLKVRKVPDGSSAAEQNQGFRTQHDVLRTASANRSASAVQHFRGNAALKQSEVPDSNDPRFEG